MIDWRGKPSSPPPNLEALMPTNIPITNHVSDFESFDFEEEILELFDLNEFNFGNTAPVSVVKEAVLKSFCGWHNGSTAASIVKKLGFVESHHNKHDQITTKGKAFLWWAHKFEVK